jgi:methyl-accepting chemotaxis protein
MLSQTTQKAISIVEGSQSNMNRLINIGDEKVNFGREVAGTCRSVLQEIIGYVDEMCSMIRETTLSTQEQTKGVSEINKAMGQIDIVTSQNAEASEQCSYAAQVLMHEVELTRTVIQDLLSVVNGKNHNETLVYAEIPVLEVPKKRVSKIKAAA